MGKNTELKEKVAASQKVPRKVAWFEMQGLSLCEHRGPKHSVSIPNRSI